MDGNRFDDITRRLAADASRRSFLKKSLAAIGALTGATHIANADAARRPRRTPVPPRCPGQQVVCASGCCCPVGTTACGAECCPAEAQCCDGACCYGTCYGEERCCPTGQIVCEGRCLDAGLCCTNDDCQAGWLCGVVTANSCTCVPTVTCATSGRNCGPFTDDCGNPLDCGTCQDPDTCGGSGSDGVCGCDRTTSCDGRCGNLPDNCGTTMDCGTCESPLSCGGGGTPNVCGCTVTTTCDGLCGEVPTNCGTTLQCGNTCSAPNSCGGGGVQNHCGCTVTTTCGDQCGVIETNCDTTMDCGDCPVPDPCNGTCGKCETCSGTKCVQAENGTDCSEGCSSAYCVDGECNITYTIPCPGDDGSGTPNPDTACNTYQCVHDPLGIFCVGTATNEGGRCSPLDPCETGTCQQGKCVGTPKQCDLCHDCVLGSCMPNTGKSCGTDHRCVDGTCSHFPSGNPPANTDVDGICSALKCADACCPGPTGGDCCNTMDDCFLADNGGGFSAYCCDPANKCGDDCCWSGLSCAGGAVCRYDEKICADDPYCAEACCGSTGPGTGTCCTSGTRCVDGSCATVPTNTCNSQDECGTNGTCAGLVYDPQTGTVITAGTCCLAAYAYLNPGVSGQVGHNFYGCCEAPNYPAQVPDSGAFCCAYQDRACPGCSCSRTSVRRWGN